MIGNKYKTTSLELTIVKWLSMFQREIGKVRYRVEGKPSDPYWVTIYEELTAINQSIKKIKAAVRKEYGARKGI